VGVKGQLIARLLAIALSILSGAAIGLAVGYFAFLGGNAADLGVISFHNWVAQSTYQLASFWAVMGATIMVGAFILWSD
jgi:hypothetical protein